MDQNVKNLILSATGSASVFAIEEIQPLWSGYGSIARYGLKGSQYPQVVVKHVQLPRQADHPRGWNTGLSHQRKIKSYQVESAWYEKYSAQCLDVSRVPRCLGLKSSDTQFLMVLEDLNSSGFPVRKSTASVVEMSACIKWLACFHAQFLGVAPVSLWAVGTYWHLETRPDELMALDDADLAAAAAEIDSELSACPFQTLVHGDAKLANFCFSVDGKSVAAVDFQYVGGGCGMKDVAYFIGSCLGESECENSVSFYVDYYFECLAQALGARHRSVDIKGVEQSWRPLFAVAWADFHRFLKGWSPGHWKLNSYSERVTQTVLKQLGQSSKRGAE